MAERWQDEPWAKDMWWSGKTTRRRFLGFSAAAAGAAGAVMLVPAPWREAFGQAKPYKLGTLQPLSGTAAPGSPTHVQSETSASMTRPRNRSKKPRR